MMMKLMGGMSFGACFGSLFLSSQAEAKASEGVVIGFFFYLITHQS